MLASASAEDTWGTSTMSKACDRLDACVRATGRNPRALDALASHLGTTVTTVQYRTHEELVKEILELRFALYGSCQDQDGEFLTFVDPDTNVVGAPVCRFDSEESLLKARTSKSIELDKRISAAHPCYEEEKQVGTALLLAILFFFVSTSLILCGLTVSISAQTGRSLGENVAAHFMQSKQMT